MSRSLNCSIHHTSQLIPSRRLQFRSTLPLGLYSFDSNRYRIRPFASQETKPSLKHKSNNNSKASPPLKTPPLPKPNAQITKPTPISTALPSVPPSTARTPDVAYPYPERIRIYHAGKGRIVFISCFKLLGIFLSIWGALILAPGYYYSPFESTWVAPACAIGFAIPMVVMNLATAPFVVKIHLSLPTWARASSARLHRYTASLPSSSEIEVTSIQWALPRYTRLRAGELYIHQGSMLGSMTLRREVPEAVRERRQWYHKRPIHKFLVAGKSGPDIPEPGAWEAVLGSILRGWGPKHQRQKIPIMK